MGSKGSKVGEGDKGSKRQNPGHDDPPRVVVVAQFDREAAAVTAERVRQSIFAKGVAAHDASGATTSNGLVQLPAELQRTIFERLDVPALLALAQTSCTLYATITSLPTLYAALLGQLHHTPGTPVVHFLLFLLF